MIPNAARPWTQGPWLYRPDEFGDWGYVRSNRKDHLGHPIVAVAREGRIVFEDELAEHRRNGTDPCEANARLIAAAPALYEALAGIRWRSDDKDNMEFAARITYFQMDKIRAALAAAQGTEARRAETENTGSVHDGPVGATSGDAPTPSPPTSDPTT